LENLRATGATGPVFVNERTTSGNDDYGFVGVGRVKTAAQSLPSFQVDTTEGTAPAAEKPVEGSYHRDFVDDAEKCEYFVGVKWHDTVPLERAVKEVGLFGTTNTVCRPTARKWRATVERLKQCFPKFDG
jgi:hypothetical protein